MRGDCFEYRCFNIFLSPDYLCSLDLSEMGKSGCLAVGYNHHGFYCFCSFMP